MGIIYFLIIWLFTGFTLGTITLMFVVRKIVTYARENDLSANTEDWLVKGVILVFVIVSFIVARWIYKRFTAISKKVLKTIILLAPVITSLVCLIFWMNPEMMQYDESTSTDIYADKEFVFGPYPDENRIQSLKNENFSGIISLLHKAIIPFEPRLLAEEKSLTSKYNIELIHIPLMPWISENEESLKKLKHFASNAKGKYYVHCYLGKDRVAVAKRIIQNAIGSDYVSGKIYARKLDTLRKFERGRLLKIDDSVYISPFPTNEEYFSLIVKGSINKVVSLLTEKVPDDIQWIKVENKLAGNYIVDYERIPIDLFPYDPIKTTQKILAIKSMPRPLLIHSFLVPSPQTDIFVNTWANGFPSLHSYLFHELMINGPVEVINQNTASGPRPEPNEFGDYLYYLGIRSVAYVGQDEEVAKADKLNAERSRLTFQAISTEALKNLDKETTWYVYGAPKEEIEQGLADQ